MSKPIDMILHCPKCGMQHIDKPEGQLYPGMTADESVAANKHYGCWDNPPHRSHLCHGCKTVWRPADVPTNGVAAIQTRGKADTWPSGVPVVQQAQQDEATTEQLLELAGALEQRRGLAIVEAVTALVSSYHEGAFRAGYETACEEITHRLRTEVWDGCLPPVDAPKPALGVPGLHTDQGENHG